MLKNCHNCNNELNINSKFCPKCGEKQKINIPNIEIAQEDEILAQEDDILAQEDDILSQEDDILAQEDDILVQEDDILSVDFIEEEVVIEDPYSSKINYEEEEIKILSNENVQKAKEILSRISIDESIEQTLYPIISPHVKGFKCIVIGNEGTKKEEGIEGICEILFVMGKIKEKKINYIPFGDMPQKFDSNKLYVIEDLLSAIQRLFNLEDFSDDSNYMQQQYSMFLERLLKAPNSSYILLNAESSQLKGFLSLNPKISFIFSQRINYPDLTNKEIYNIFINNLPEFHKLQLTATFEFDFIEYLERNRRFFPFNNTELGLYLSQTASKQPMFKLPKEKYNDESLEESFSSIIGMENVKEQVNELSIYLKARKKLEEAGAILPHFHLHMMFLGSPGVGKTTIARIISKTLFDLGYIREDKLIEVTSKDLVGNGNQTGMKTNRAILSALGGVLFVDEAYSLSNSCGQAGAEAIANLVKSMEDYKSDLVVMFAGYTLEMNDFIKSNSGISSRIAYTFQFENYTVDELYAIFELKAKTANIIISDDAKKPIIEIIEWGAGRKNFGNGRYIDKLFQRTLTKHATLNLPKKEILTIRKESIPTVEEIMKTFGRFMG